MSLYSDTLSWFRVIAPTPLCCVISGVAAYTNFSLYSGLIWLGLDHTIEHICCNNDVLWIVVCPFVRFLLSVFYLCILISSNSSWHKENNKKTYNCPWNNAHNTKDYAIRTPRKAMGELGWSRVVSSSCSTNCTRRVTLIKNPVISYDKGQDYDRRNISLNINKLLLSLGVEAYSGSPCDSFCGYKAGDCKCFGCCVGSGYLGGSCNHGKCSCYGNVL